MDENAKRPNAPGESGLQGARRVMCAQLFITATEATNKLAIPDSMVRLLVILLVSSCLLVAFCGAQVNFSPSWGKRSITPENCKTTMDSLMYINKLIQSEAEKILDCEKFTS
uniref:Adipokinetic hormone 1 n=1 Tax=Timema monikensis TaxID=170555 RepID=A0A7R9EJC7_9NEOP|nr:unnamed protein product [Timema monikensis]